MKTKSKGRPRFRSAPPAFALLAALATAACGGGDGGSPADPPGSSGSSPSEGGGAGASPAAGAGGASAGAGAGPQTGGGAGAAGSAGGTSGSGGAGGSPPVEPAWFTCQASEQAFVRRAYAAVLGHRPAGQAEVNYYADLTRAVDEAEGFDASAPFDPAVSRPSRAALVDALAAGRADDYLERWTEIYLDALRVQRVDELQNAGCFDRTLHPNPASLVGLVRDGDPKTAQAGASFTMLDLLRGALLADDMTAPYIGNLFAMLTRTYSGANADPVELELSRRSDFGAWFNAAYLHRDVVCLGCHNSEFSVTQSGDPATNRHYPLPGLLEKSLFGASVGPPTLDGHEGPTRAWAILRYDGFATPTPPPVGGSQACAQACPAWEQTCSVFPCEFLCEGINDAQWACIEQANCDENEVFGCLSFASGTRPWGWSGECGSFNPDVPDDVAGVDAQFGGLAGKRVTAFDTARLLQQGFAELRQTGLVVDAQNQVQSPAMAFAYLVAMNVVEQVWREIVGTPLTIPLYFPRNAAARDELARLTDAFVAAGFSNRALLKAIVASPAFNLAGPDDACWQKPYAAPPLFDPWATSEPEAARRGNNPSDAVAPLAGRAVVRTLSKALDWGNPLPSFPQNGFQYQASPELGFFLHNAEPGFRGFDFQARLSWELAFGACLQPDAGPATDFVDGLLAQAANTPGATARDVVLALKDRLIGDPSIDEATERAALEGLLGLPLDATPAAQLPEGKARALCGALAATPQMLLAGLPPRDAAEPPRLTPPSASYQAFCAAFAGATFGPYAVGCEGGKVTVAKAAPAPGAVSLPKP